MAFDWLSLILGGGSLLSQLLKGGDQERGTFENEKRGNLSLDPRDLLGQGITGVSRAGDMAMDWLGEDVTLPGAYAQAPPTFTGGGLPMPIGVTGRDPAVANPGAHLRLAGRKSRDPFQGIGNLMSGDPTEGHGTNPGAGSQPWNPGRHPGQSMLSADPKEALAALKLLGVN